MHVFVGMAVLLFGLTLIGCASSVRPREDDETALTEMPELVEREDLIPVGAVAPDFELTDHTGQSFRLSTYRGRPVVVIFYAGDFQPGCTRQLCAVRNAWPEFKARGFSVVGVNPVSRQRHKRFADHHGFPFPLLSDPPQRVTAAFGCKGLGGYPVRTVYAIDPSGRVALARRGMLSISEMLAAISTN